MVTVTSKCCGFMSVTPFNVLYDKHPIITITFIVRVTPNVPSPARNLQKFGSLLGLCKDYRLFFLGYTNISAKFNFMLKREEPKKIDELVMNKQVNF